MRTAHAEAAPARIRQTGAMGLLFFLLFLAALLLTGCSDRLEAERSYFCPMHPEVTGSKPGDCPICGMRLVEREGRTSGADHAGGAGRQEAGSEKALPPQILADRAPVAIPARHADWVDLRTEEVVVRRIVREVRASARVVPDERRLHRVTARAGGWVEALYVNASGQAVRKGDPLLRLYSPEIYSAEQEYLIARRHQEELARKEIPGASAAGSDLLAASRKRLELWGVPEEEMRRLDREGKAEKTVTLSSPASGFVAEKNVVEGQKIEAGEPLFLLSDLSKIWVEADLFEADAPLVEVGMEAVLVLPSLPDRSFKGKVRFLNPFLDPSTRTLRARIELSNPDFLLKPGMLGEARLRRDFGEHPAVPEAALLKTSQSALVYRQNEEGRLEPVEVETGVAGGGFVRVIRGLTPGDRVVTSGNFLVDSESSLAGALRSASSPGRGE